MSSETVTFEKITNTKRRSASEWGSHKERTDSKRYKNDHSKTARHNSNKKDRWVENSSD